MADLRNVTVAGCTVNVVAAGHDLTADAEMRPPFRGGRIKAPSRRSNETGGGSPSRAGGSARKLTHPIRGVTTSW